MDPELDTQVDDQQVEQDHSQDGDNSGGGDQPFLKVNDRTVYKTSEDALKGFNEAQTTITSLSGIKSQVEHYVGKGNATPELINALLQELVASRKEAAERKAQSTKQTTSAEEDKEFEGKTAEEIAQTKRGRQWLKENAEKVGLSSKAEVEALKKELAELKGGFSNRDKEERESAISEGQSRITSLLAEAKVVLSEEERTELEELISARINQNDTTLAKWLKGDRAAKLALIEDGYKKFLPVVKPGASSTIKKVVENGRQKQKLISRNTPRLPQGDEGRGQNQGGQKKPVKIGDKSLHDKARALMEKMNSDE